MRDLKAEKVRYRISGSDPEIALAHALGSALIELQQLEFSIISHLSDLANTTSSDYDASFDIFASKTFGNLIREMHRHDFMKSFATEMMTAKEKRDFFVHKFLFHRFGGELTTETEYEEMIVDAANLGTFFANTKTNFQDFMLRSAPLIMIAAKRDANTGEFIIVESEFSKKENPLTGNET